MKKQKLLVALVAAGLSSTSFAAADVSAKLEINTDAVSAADTTFDQNGHVEFGVSSGKTMGDNYVKAKGAIRLTLDGDTSVRDVYLQAGSDAWDAKLGRFETTKLFPLGKDIMVKNAGSSVYKADKARGRIGDGGGQIALTFNTSDTVSIELGTIVGDAATGGTQESLVSGIRPVVTFKGDGFKVLAGYESLTYDVTGGGEIDKSGFGLATNFDLGSANINLAYASLDDSDSNRETTSYTANATMGDFGVGVLYSDDDNAGTSTDVTTVYAAYSMPLMDIEGLKLSFGGSHSTATGAEDTTALRMRLNYAF